MDAVLFYLKGIAGVLVFFGIPLLLAAFPQSKAAKIEEKISKWIENFLLAALAVVLCPILLLVVAAVVTVPGAWAVVLALGGGRWLLKR